MLLFVTSNKALASVTTPPAGWTLEGTRLSSTDTETILYSKVAAANDAGTQRRPSTFSATTKATLTLLAYDGTAADPVAVFASAAETTNRDDPHDTGRQRRDRRFVRRLLLGGQVVGTTTGWTLPAGQTQRSIVARHRRRPHHLRGVRPERASRRSARSPARTATAAASTRQGDDVDRRARARPDRRTRTSRRSRRSR